MTSFKNLRGTVDLLPDQITKWQNVEEIIRQQMLRNSIKEIRTPILESTELFIRGIGESTDVVSKEMYTFMDRGDRSCTLRPEGTASVVRAVIDKLSANPFHKLWYMGPMFRYERPQAGRQRQFHQLGVEFIGYESIRSDVEIISLAWDLLQKLGLKNLNLEINSLGDSQDRSNFQESFLSWLDTNNKFLDQDSLKRVSTNPLRIFDTKNKQTIKLLQDSPKLIDFLSDKNLERFITIKKELEFLEIPFTVNPKLVRGLDYYTHTAFEIKSGLLGSQSTVSGGGRYNNLINQMGGKKSPAIGFAIGLERLMILASEEFNKVRKIDMYIINKGKNAESLALKLSRILRDYDLLTELDLSGANITKQLKKANKLNAKNIVIIGEEEAENNQFIIRRFCGNEEENLQDIISLNDIKRLEDWLQINLKFKI
ncbi:MAG: histidine--tRNA ligase [Chloroflexi bacterium]|nr:histidine--tRNA ligase [Chloroflexota bacterium]